MSVQGGRTAASIPPRMNMSCPGPVSLRINTTVRRTPSSGGADGPGVVGSVVPLVGPPSHPMQAAKIGSS